MDSDLTLAATVATELGVDASSPRLPRLVSAASEACRRFMRRPSVHYRPALSEVVASRGTQRLVLGLTPVLSVTSVTLEDGTVVDAADYLVEDADAGLLYRRAGWAFTGVVRAGLLYSDQLPGSAMPSITVLYVGGWVTPAQATSVAWAGPARSLPFDVEEAAVQTAVTMYHRGGQDTGVASEGLGDYSVSYRAPNVVGVVNPLPDSAQALLASYVRPLG